MAIDVVEKFESRSGDHTSLALVYLVRGTTDDAAARAALDAAAPTLHDTLYKDSDQVAVEPIAEGLWLGTVRYVPNEWDVPPDPVYSFDTSGGSQHITQSLGTIHSYSASLYAAPDFGRAIGVSSDAVEGVDITVPVYQFSETHYFTDAAVTLAFKSNLFYLTGKVNTDSFRGCNPGECLFLGASGSKKGKTGLWEITYKWAGSPNVTGLTIGSMTGIDKDGWDYLWVRYEDRVDDTAKALIKYPKAVYVERVYARAAFSSLGL